MKNCWAGMIASLLAGCWGSPVAQAPAPAPDGGAAAPLTELSCSHDCRDFVIASLRFSDQPDHGVPGPQSAPFPRYHNQRVDIVRALDQLVGLGFQAQLARNMASGASLNLLRLQLPEGTQSLTWAQSWVGTPVVCCEGSPNMERCGVRSSAWCFGGSFTFEVEPSLLTLAPLRGSLSPAVTAHAPRDLALGPGAVRLRVPLTADRQVTLLVKRAEIRARLVDTRLEGGVLRGLVPVSEVEATIVPALAELLSARLNDQTVEANLRMAISKAFDADGNGDITPAELKGSAAAGYLAGDLDISADEKGVSLALDFEAVGARILY